jgi:glutamate synthase (NADPH/NADH) small chain
VTFRTGVEVGVTLPMDVLIQGHDAVVMAGGAEWPRNLEVPGRELKGIHYAMEFLTQQNKRNAGDAEDRAAPSGTISAKGKHVVVIGGGDTGSDCIGTSARQGAASIVQIEIMPKPPVKENKAMVWPDWPTKLRSSHAHDEGVSRDWAVLTKTARGVDGRVTALDCVRVEWVAGAGGRMEMKEVPGSEFTLQADLVLLAMGFMGPRKQGLVEQAGVTLDPRGNVLANTDQYATSVPKVFSAGDMRRGPSLVVWAIREGRQCARAVDEFLMGTTSLPR